MVYTEVHVGFGSGGHRAYIVLKIFVTESGELAFAVFLLGSIILAEGF